MLCVDLRGLKRTVQKSWSLVFNGRNRLKQLGSVSHDFLRRQKCVRQLNWLYPSGLVLIVNSLPDLPVLLTFGCGLFNQVGLAFVFYAECLVWDILSFGCCSTRKQGKQLQSSPLIAK